MDAFHTNLWGESPQKSLLLVKCQRGAFPANSHRGKASISEGTENNIISIISFIPTKRELESWQTSKLKQILAEKNAFQHQVSSASYCILVQNKIVREETKWI